MPLLVPAELTRFNIVHGRLRYTPTEPFQALLCFILKVVVILSQFARKVHERVIWVLSRPSPLCAINAYSFIRSAPAASMRGRRRGEGEAHPKLGQRKTLVKNQIPSWDKIIKT